MSEIKICKLCGQAKPREEFVPNGRAKDGHTSCCFQCRRPGILANLEKAHVKNRVKAKETRLKGEKRCPVCLQVKSLRNFRKCSTNLDGTGKRRVECENEDKRGKAKVWRARRRAAKESAFAWPLEKECVSCNVVKPIIEFPAHNTAIGGHFSYCRICYAQKVAAGAIRKAASQSQVAAQKLALETLQKGAKLCTRCGKETPLSEFFQRIRNADGRRSICKKCTYTPEFAKYQKQQREKHSEGLASRDLKKKYGITLQEYAEILQGQGGVCAICKETKRQNDWRTKGTRRMHVDHDHTTGKIRGMLCWACNVAIGMFREHPEYLAAAITYLSQHSITVSSDVAA